MGEFFLFPLGNTSSETRKISVLPSGCHLNTTKAQTEEGDANILGVFRLLLSQITVHPHTSSTEFKE